MEKTITVIIIGILCLSTLSAISTKTIRGLPDATPLQVAEKAAIWTISQAIPENGGYKWLDYLQGPYYASSVPFGSAGFGTFYLELYNETCNSTYLDYAKGVAQWIMGQAISDSGGYKWPHPDDDINNPGWWLSPIVSGIGDFLLKMYQTTGNATYLEYSEGAAQWLEAMAYWGEPGCFIPYNPPNPYGSQAAHGIGPGREAYTVTFLLHLYEETGNDTYLNCVKGTAEWLISGPDKATVPSGYKWSFNRPYGSFYASEGNAQIALFFYEIYQVLGNATYLEHARGAMNWLLSQAVIDGNMAKWFEPSYGRYRTLPFSGEGGVEGFWGMPEPNDLFMRVYDLTQNGTYLDYAEKLAIWITSPSIAVPVGGGYAFPDFEGSSFYSAYQNAKIYSYLNWLYRVTGNVSYRDYADGAVQWIIFNAMEINGGYTWATIPYFPYNATRFESGAAGIGYYLINEQVPSPDCSLTITTSTGGTTIPSPGTYVQEAGSSIEVTANANADYTFSYWELDSVNVGSVNPYTVTMNQNHTLNAVFTYTPPPPALSISITPLSASICVGDSVAFTSTVSGGYAPYSYQWYLGGNPVSGATSNSWTFTPTASGVYYVYLKVTDTLDNATQSETARITVASVPVGGYSFPIGEHASAKPLTPYLTLIAVIAIGFIVTRRKTTRDAK